MKGILNYRRIYLRLCCYDLLQPNDKWLLHPSPAVGSSAITRLAARCKDASCWCISRLCTLLCLRTACMFRVPCSHPAVLQVRWSLSAPVLWRCLWRWSSPLADIEAATGTCFGTLIGTIRRPQDLSLLKCWCWFWRVCNNGVDAVVWRKRTPRWFLAVDLLLPSLPGRWLNVWNS